MSWFETLTAKATLEVGQGSAAAVAEPEAGESLLLQPVLNRTKSAGKINLFNPVNASAVVILKFPFLD